MKAASLFGILIVGMGLGLCLAGLVLVSHGGRNIDLDPLLLPAARATEAAPPAATHDCAHWEVTYKRFTAAAGTPVKLGEWEPFAPLIFGEHGDLIGYAMRRCAP
jgi:hypothetical protein